MNLSNITLKSDRIILRAISLNDIDEIFESFTSEVTTYMYPAPAKERSETEAFVKFGIKNLEEGTDLQMVICDADTGAFYGCCGLHNIGSSTPELGIWLRVEAHGKKVGREAIDLLVKWGRANIQFEHFKYPVDRRNIASRKIPESYQAILVKEEVYNNQAGDTLEIIEYWFR